MMGRQPIVSVIKRASAPAIAEKAMPAIFFHLRAIKRVSLIVDELS
jgi:hypothetical protein